MALWSHWMFVASSLQTIPSVLLHLSGCLCGYLLVNGLKKINCTKVLHSVWARVRVICIEKKVTILRGNVTHAALWCQFANVGTKTCTWVRAHCPRLNDREFFNICPESLLINCVECGHAISGCNSLHPEPLALGLELRRRRLPGVWQRSGQGGERCHLRVHAPPWDPFSPFFR